MMESGTRLDAAIAAAEKDTIWVYRPMHLTEKEEGPSGPSGFWKDLTDEERKAYSAKRNPPVTWSYLDEVERDVDEVLNGGTGDEGARQAQGGLAGAGRHEGGEPSEAEGCAQDRMDAP